MIPHHRPHRKRSHRTATMVGVFVASVLCFLGIGCLTGCSDISELVNAHKALKPGSLAEWEGVQIEGMPYKNYVFRSSVAFIQTDADVTVARTLDGISVRTDPKVGRKAQGSGAMGVLLTEDGYILTCQHVVDNNDDRLPLFAIVPTDNGSNPASFAVYETKVVFRAAAVQGDADVAIVKIDFDDPYRMEGRSPSKGRPEAFLPAPRLQANPLAASGVVKAEPARPARSTEVNDIRVVHHGVGASGPTWCAGHITELTNALDDTVPHWIVRTDLPLVPGDSGGAVVSEDGTLWGVAFLTTFTPGDRPDSLAVLPDAAWLDRLITRLRAEEAQRKTTESGAADK